jgi:putative inorganic carbon (HCO3(-)) transporter
MNSKDLSLPLTDATAGQPDTPPSRSPQTPAAPPAGEHKVMIQFSPFWQDRLFEGGLIISMALYYIVGNHNFHLGFLSQLNPLVSLPFLLIFAALAWFRLSFAIALLPLSLPYYLYQKVVMGSARFSLAEVTLTVCVLLALAQFVVPPKGQHSRVSLSELRQRIGPFAIPMLVFLLMAALSIVVAYSRTTALRAFREEVFDPLLYLLLALLYLRSRQDITRLLGALLGTGLLIALLGLAQYFLFKNTLTLEEGVRRVHAVYGSANSIGLLFDYIVPIALAWLVAKVSLKSRLLALALCVPMLLVLYLTQSLGAWIAIAVAAVFVVLLSVRNRKLLLLGGLVALLLIVVVVVAYHTKILDYVLERHTNQQGVSTVTKRLYLWRSAWNMIYDSPWLGYGMDNWLCHYSRNTICFSPLHHYWILQDPVTGAASGLRDEPNLSHPHDIFLHVWVSIGFFGLLAFVSVLVLFYWLLARILRHLCSVTVEHSEQLHWMTVGVGAAMLAAMGQGLVDSAFLEQDLAFCFWTLVAAMLILRALSNTPWHARVNDVPGA